MYVCMYVYIYTIYILYIYYIYTIYIYIIYIYIYTVVFRDIETTFFDPASVFLSTH